MDAKCAATRRNIRRQSDITLPSEERRGSCALRIHLPPFTLFLARGRKDSQGFFANLEFFQEYRIVSRCIGRVWIKKYLKIHTEIYLEFALKASIDVSHYSKK